MKKPKNRAFLYYFAAVGFYIAAFFDLRGGLAHTSFVTYLCIGSAILCFGTTALRTGKKKDDGQE